MKTDRIIKMVGILTIVMFTHVKAGWPSLPAAKTIPQTLISFYISKNAAKIEKGIAIAIGSLAAVYGAYQYIVKPLLYTNRYILDSLSIKLRVCL